MQGKEFFLQLQQYTSTAISPPSERHGRLPCPAGATAKQLQLVMQALTLSQAAKALAQSVSSQLASQSGAAGTNGVPSLQVGLLARTLDHPAHGCQLVHWMPGVQGTDIHMSKFLRAHYFQADGQACRVTALQLRKEHSLQSCLCKAPGHPASPQETISSQRAQ